MKQAIARIAAVALAAVLLAALFAAPALLINWYESSLPAQWQLVPTLWNLREWMSYLPIAAPGVLGVWLFTRGRTTLSSPSRARHFAKLILLLAFGFVAAASAMLGIAVTGDDFIFPTEQPDVSVKSPSGKRVAHLFHDCFFSCTLSYAIEEQGSGSMQRVAILGAGKDMERLPTIKWLSDDQWKFEGGDEQFRDLEGRVFPEPAALEPGR